MALKTARGKADQGLVSSADEMAESLIFKRINKIYPGEEILSEESAFRDGLQDFSFLSQQEGWIVDPLDGTHNYLYGLDYFAVAIAYHQHGVPIMGVSYRPATGEAFWAIKGKGAYSSSRLGSNRAKKLSLRKKAPPLSHSLLAVNFPTNKQDQYFFDTLKAEALGLRRIGSTVLNLCYTADGRFAGFCAKKAFPWDFAAPLVVAKECGLTFSRLDGSPFFIHSPDLVTAPFHLHQQLVKIYNSWRSE